MPGDWNIFPGVSEFKNLHSLSYADGGGLSKQGIYPDRTLSSYRDNSYPCKAMLFFGRPL